MTPQAYTQGGHENFLRSPEPSRSERKYFSNIFTNGKRGNILAGNIIFIILNFIFLVILVLFLLKQGSGAIVLEQSYAKQIALLIDSAKPGMIIKLNMEQAKELAEKNGLGFEDVVKINENIVIVKLSEKGGYEYSFFNDVDVSVYPDAFPSQNYIIKINEYK